MSRPQHRPPPSPAEVARQVGSLPWMTPEQGEMLTRFLREHRLSSLLELGFYHGVSTCYLAAAVADRPEGRVVTIDKEKVRSLEPSIEELLRSLELEDRVTVCYEPRSYVWRLMKMLEADPEPRFDFCYVDGAHQWAVDGFAFFLVDRLLKPGGWILFDDLDWTVASRPELAGEDWATHLTEEERTTPQIRKVYELLVKTHPDYDRFRTEQGWAFARKAPGTSRAGQPRTETVIQPVPVTPGMLLDHLKRRKRDA